LYVGASEGQTWETPAEDDMLSQWYHLIIIEQTREMGKTGDRTHLRIAELSLNLPTQLLVINRKAQNSLRHVATHNIVDLDHKSESGVCTSKV